MRILVLESVVIVFILAADEEDLSLTSTDGEMRKLREIMLKDNSLNEITWNLFSSICLIQEQNHWLILMILFKAIIKSNNMENTAFASWL